MQSPPFPRYLVPHRSKYSTQHHVLKHPQLPFLRQCQRPSFTPIQYMNISRAKCLQEPHRGAHRPSERWASSDRTRTSRARAINFLKEEKASRILRVLPLGSTAVLENIFTRWSASHCLVLFTFSFRLKANIEYLFTSDVRLTVHRNSVWIRKTNWMSLFVFFISLLIVA